VILLQELGKQRHREVDLTSTWAPDESLLDQRLSVHGGPTLVTDPERVGNFAYGIRPFPE
jgi:hypothetical protein